MATVKIEDENGSDNVSNLISDRGLKVEIGASNADRLTALETVIARGIKKADSIDKNEEIKDKQNEQTRQNKRYKTLEDAVTRCAFLINKGSKTRYESIKDFQEDWKNYSNKRSEILNKNIKGINLTGAQLVKLLTASWEVLYKIGNTLLDETSKRVEWLKNLEDSGVKLSKGFDNSFTQLANDAKLSHDNLVKMLIGSSNHIAKLNGMGINGAQKFATMSGKIIGQFGYNTSNASSVINDYTENMLSLKTSEQLAIMDVTNQSQLYARQLKALSAATGKQVETLIKENELREDSLFARKMRSEAKPLYDALKQMGLSDSLIKAIYTGRPNDEFQQMMVTPEGRFLMKNFGNISMRYRAGDQSLQGIGLIQALENVRRNPMVQSSLTRFQNMSPELAAALDNSPVHVKGIGTIVDIAGSRLDLNGANQTYNNTGDTGSYNSFNKLQIEKDRLANNQNKNLSLYTRTGAAFADMGSGILSMINSLLEVPILGEGISWATKILPSTELGGWAMKQMAWWSMIYTANKAANTGILDTFKTFGKGLIIPILKGIGIMGVLAGTVTTISMFTTWLGEKLGSLVGGGAGGATLGILGGGLSGTGIGALGGAIVGLMFGGPAGAVLGAKLGASVGGILGATLGGISGYNAKEDIEVSPSYYKDSVEYNYNIKNNTENMVETSNENTTLLKEMNDGIHSLNVRVNGIGGTLYGDSVEKRLSAASPI